MEATGIAEEGLAPGTPVEVVNRFVTGWTRGFVVEDVTGGECRLRRQSDGAVLPASFATTDVRPVVR